MGEITRYFVDVLFGSWKEKRKKGFDVECLLMYVDSMFVG